MIRAMPKVRTFWSAISKQHARTLAADKFVDFSNGASDKDWRKRSCEQICTGMVLDGKLASWSSFCRSLPCGDDGLLFGKLKSRLIVNQAGGVIENGGLSLDRNSGLPVITGSAVKGCARKAAIIRLHDEPNASKKLELAGNIVRIFGWSDQDWRSGRKRIGKDEGEYHSDLCYACGEHDWPSVQRQLSERLATTLRVAIDNPVRPWESLPNFAGSILFLPSYPWKKDPGIELDIVTPHHMKYYGEEPGFEDAPDTEEPKPNIFPVVSCQNEPIFVFTLVDSRRSKTGDLELAKDWLREGLTMWGIGGKTSAGYGWFESTAELDKEILSGQPTKTAQDKP